MRWYERLYVGEKAQKDRYSIIQAVREEKSSGYYILTLPSNKKNMLDIYPARTLKQPYYREQNLLILGIAADYQDAAILSATIIGDVYKKTGGYDVERFLEEEMADEQV